MKVKRAALFAAGIGLIVWMAGCGGGQAPTVVSVGNSAQQTGYSASALGDATNYAIVVILDGIRYCESFGDDDPANGYRPSYCPAWDGTSHDLVPVMWNDLRPQGSVGLEVYNTTYETTTMIGVGTIMSGREASYTAQMPKYLRNPTIHEYLRKDLGLPASQSRQFTAQLDWNAAGWIPLSKHKKYGEAYWPQWTDSGSSDTEVYNNFKAALLAERPKFSLVHLWDIDHNAHVGDWAGYTGAIANADALMGDLWSSIEADPVLGGHTALFIITDHGRNCGDWANHETKDDCTRRMTFMALGPDIKAGHESVEVHDQGTVVPTVGALLGFSSPYSTNIVFSDILNGGAAAAPSSGSTTATTTTTGGGSGGKGGGKNR